MRDSVRKGYRAVREHFRRMEIGVEGKDGESLFGEGIEREGNM